MREGKGNLKRSVSTRKCGKGGVLVPERGGQRPGHYIFQSKDPRRSYWKKKADNDYSSRGESVGREHKGRNLLDGGSNVSAVPKGGQKLPTTKAEKARTGSQGPKSADREPPGREASGAQLRGHRPQRNFGGQRPSNEQPEKESGASRQRLRDHRMTGTKNCTKAEERLASTRKKGERETLVGKTGAGHAGKYK